MVTMVSAPTTIRSGYVVGCEFARVGGAVGSGVGLVEGTEDDDAFVGKSWDGFAEVEQWLRSDTEQDGQFHVRTFAGGRGGAVVAVEVAVEEQQPGGGVGPCERGGHTDEQGAVAPDQQWPEPVSEQLLSVVTHHVGLVEQIGQADDAGGGIAAGVGDRYLNIAAVFDTQGLDQASFS